MDSLEKDLLELELLDEELNLLLAACLSMKKRSAQQGLIFGITHSIINII
jgi:hypothetical protein